MACLLTAVGQKPNPSETVACQLSSAPPDIPAHARSAALCQQPTYAVQQTRSYSITSSAVASNAVGTSSPSAFAGFTLMANLNRVGCSNGRSGGFGPFGMHSKKTAPQGKFR